MVDADAVKEAMYEIFNETDLQRAIVLEQLIHLSKTTGVPLPAVCYIAGELVWNRIKTATSSEQLRSDICELVTIISIHRADLDQALGERNGSGKKANTWEITENAR